MRTRLVKPGFFTSETLSELPALTRLLFIGLWCAADKEGRLLDRPRQIKAQILPYDDCDVHAALDELQRVGHIKRYQVDSLQIIQVINFTKHQTLTTWEKKETEALPQDFRSTSKPKPKKSRSTSDYINIDVNKNTSIAESATPTPPEPEIPDPVILQYPLAGNHDNPLLWPLTESRLAKFKQIYPGVNVLQECRSALGWCMTHETRRKTAGGMPAFLNGWLTREQNKSQGSEPTNGHRPSKVVV